MLGPAIVRAQQPASTTRNRPSSFPDAPTPQAESADPNNPNDPNAQYGKQSKRILGIIPNHRAISALPQLSFEKKFWLATEDTFDYSNFLLVAGLAGVSMAQKSQPTFGQGAAGYGRYYWHTFADGGIENYVTKRSRRPSQKKTRDITHWAKSDSSSGPAMP